jgi:hypothetical protein
MTPCHFSQTRLQTSPTSNGYPTGNIGNHMTKKTVEPTSTPIQRTSAGLRDAIFDEIDAVRNGTSNPTRANAIAKLATGIVETVRMEIEVQRHLRTTTARPQKDASDLTGLGSPLALGNAA